MVKKNISRKRIEQRIYGFAKISLPGFLGLKEIFSRDLGALYYLVERDEVPYRAGSGLHLILLSFSYF
jgi:hypothetical protein